MIINHYYEKAAFWLTGLENYKTRSKFEGSLIFKLVSFEFINAYNVMIYLAFVKVFTHGCYEIDEHGEVEGDNECMFEL